MNSFAVTFDSDGQASALSGLPKSKEIAAQSLLWVHLDGNKKSSRQWLTREAGLDRVIVNALLETQVQPRYDAFEKGLLLILRSISSVAPADADALVSLRMWFTQSILVTVSLHKTNAVTAVKDELLGGHAPKSPAEISVLLSKQMLEPLGGLMRELDEDMCALEDQVFSPGPDPQLEALTEGSREAIYLRRHLKPSYAALRSLGDDAPDWVGLEERQRFRERAERAKLLLEDAELLRERASIAQGHIESHLAADMNHRLYIFSVLAVLFLPLGFITGLFGINVGGMPGAENQAAFWWFCGSLFALTFGMLAGLRWWRWL